jgi:cytochrome c oxidase subunit 3
MKIGKAEPVIELEPVRKRRPTLSGGSGGPGRDNGGGGDGGGSGPDGRDFQREDAETNSPGNDKARFVTAFLLIVVTMTFGGLIGAYVVVANNNVLEWRPFALPIQLWISTAAIIASSVAYHFAQRAIAVADNDGSRRWLIVTTALGAVFVSSQLLSWIALRSRGFYMAGNPYAGFFYILTAAHAVHVIGGIVALGAILLRSWYPSGDTAEFVYRRNLSVSVGWYWHFLGILWIVLFILLGFWK